VKQWMRDKPQYLIYDVSQNDNGSYCQCPACKALDEREGCPQGSLLAFINQVADAVKDEFPGKYVATFAYAYSEQPPKTIKPRTNVVIRLCTFCCASIFEYEKEGYSCNQFFRKERNPGSFAENIRAWSALTNNITIWDYAGSLNHTLIPFPNFTSMGKNMKWFGTFKMKGYLAQSAYHGLPGGLWALRAYLISKLAWDPDLDPNAIIDDFLNGYYGKAAGPIRQYIDLMEQNLPPHDTEELPNDPPFESSWCHCSPARWWLKPELLQKYDAMFDQAEKLVQGDNALLMRVKIARLELQYAQIRLLPKDDPKRADVMAKFFDVMRRGGIREIGYGFVPGVRHAGPEDFKAWLEKEEEQKDE